MAVNLSGLLLFMYAKNRAPPGTSPQDATRLALPVLFIRPPILGLVLASTLTQNQAASAPANAGGSGANLAAAGHSLLSAAGVPAPPQKYFPSFLGLSSRHAHESASGYGLKAKSDPKTPLDGFAHPVISKQVPAPDAKWEDDTDTVTLSYRERDPDTTK
jgi:hypothetical protein